MRKVTLILGWLAFLTITAASQQPVPEPARTQELEGVTRVYVSAAQLQQPLIEPGRAEELKGVTRVYVSAANNDERNNIIAEIRKRLPQLTIADRAEEAEVWLLFSAKRRSFPTSDPTIDVGSTRASGTSMQYQTVASGDVIKPVTRERARRLIEFRETAETTISFSERALSVNFAKAFVKSYQKANP